MSLARDDIGISGALNAIEAEFIKSGTLEKPNNNQEISGPEDKEPEINDVFEKESSVNQSDDVKRIEQLQEEYNALEVQKQALDEVDKELAGLEEPGQEPDPAETEKPEKTVEELLPKEQSVTGESSGQESETDEEQEGSAGRISELRLQVNEKQQQLAELQHELREEINSTVELRLDGNSNPVETVEQQAENLKNSVVEDIKQYPQKSQAAQITHLNANLLLAMLSL